MKAKWSKATKLGVGERYILKHYDKLTAYLNGRIPSKWVLAKECKKKQSPV